jgi:HSP20 family protein
VDLTETGREYVFEVDLPGLKPQEVQVRVDTDELSISGQRAPRYPGGKHMRVERPSGSFVRHLPLPPETEGETSATFCDGVLALHVPRTRPDREIAKARTGGREPEEAAV